MNDPRDAFHFFSWKNPGPFLVHCKKLVVDLPPKKFLRLAAFDHNYVAGVKRSGGIVHVWSFKEALENDCSHVSSLWTRDLGNRNTVTITAVAFSNPILLVGKSSGCCELWEVSRNTRVGNLQHGASWQSPGSSSFPQTSSHSHTLEGETIFAITAARKVDLQ